MLAFNTKEIRINNDNVHKIHKIELYLTGLVVDINLYTFITKPELIQHRGNEFVHISFSFTENKFLNIYRERRWLSNIFTSKGSHKSKWLRVTDDGIVLRSAKGRRIIKTVSKECAWNNTDN